VRLGVERNPRLPGIGRELIDVLCGAEKNSHADAFLSVAAFLPVVLADVDDGVACTQRHAEQDAVLFPPFFNPEAEPSKHATLC
jgi:hypothetical protein